jgi:hypothetical protein
MGCTDVQIGMEAIGRVRKVKKKVMEGVEKVVEKVTHNSEETKRTNEAKVDDRSVKSEQMTAMNGENEQEAPRNSDVNTVKEGLEKLQVSRDIKV